MWGMLGNWWNGCDSKNNSDPQEQTTPDAVESAVVTPPRTNHSIDSDPTPVWHLFMAPRQWEHGSQLIGPVYTLRNDDASSNNPEYSDVDSVQVRADENGSENESEGDDETASIETASKSKPPSKQRHQTGKSKSKAARNDQKPKSKKASRDDTEYFVQKLKGVRGQDGRYEFLVQWTETWEPQENLSPGLGDEIQQLLESYDGETPNKKKRRRKR